MQNLQIVLQNDTFMGILFTENRAKQPRISKINNIINEKLSEKKVFFIL